ncbi:MAG: SBBP repeat-containing protein [Ignavibacteria bacterium]|nr:SBBP repeat-containing protein [Ignavibacteria bacterium]
MKTIYILLLFFCNSLQAQAAKLNIRMISRILVISAIALTLLAFEHQPSFSQVTQQWVARYTGPGDAVDYANSLAVDGSGNVYVTGYSIGNVQPDYATVKYNSSGVQQWVERYSEFEYSAEAATSLAVDGSGNVYVTGESNGSGSSFDYATIKYNSSGIQQWVVKYNGPGNSDDRAISLAVDGTGNVYVTGKSTGSGTSFDYATVKYNSSGVQQWVARYNRVGNSDDRTYSLAVDGSGNVYVTGVTGYSGNRDYATIKYNSAGVQQWVARYNGPGNSWDEANSLAVDGSGNVYVTGYSTGSGTSNVIMQQ